MAMIRMMSPTMPPMMSFRLRGGFRSGGDDAGSADADGAGCSVSFGLGFSVGIGGRDYGSFLTIRRQFEGQSSRASFHVGPARRLYARPFCETPKRDDFLNA